MTEPDLSQFLSQRSIQLFRAVCAAHDLTSPPQASRLSLEFKHAIDFIAAALCANINFLQPAATMYALARPSASLITVAKSAEALRRCARENFRRMIGLVSLESKPVVGLAHLQVMQIVGLDSTLSKELARQYEALYQHGDGNLDPRATVSITASFPVRPSPTQLQVSFSEIHDTQARVLLRAIELTFTQTAPCKKRPHAWLLSPSSYLDVGSSAAIVAAQKPVLAQKHTFRDVVNELELKTFVSLLKFVTDETAPQLLTIKQMPLKKEDDPDLFLFFEADGAIRATLPDPLPESIILLVPPKIQAFEMVRLLVRRIAAVIQQRHATMKYPTYVRVLLMKPLLLQDDPWELSFDKDYYYRAGPFDQRNDENVYFYTRPELLRDEVTEACMHKACESLAVRNPSLSIHIGDKRALLFAPNAYINVNLTDTTRQTVHVYVRAGAVLVTTGFKYVRASVVNGQVPEFFVNSEHAAASATEIMEWIECQSIEQPSPKPCTVRIQFDDSMSPEDVRHGVSFMVAQFAFAMRATVYDMGRRPRVTTVAFYFKLDISQPRLLRWFLMNVALYVKSAIRLQRGGTSLLTHATVPMIEPPPFRMRDCWWRRLAAGAMDTYPIVLPDGRGTIELMTRWPTWTICEIEKAKGIEDIVYVLRSLLCERNDMDTVNLVFGQPTGTIPDTAEAKFRIWNPNNVPVQQSLDGLNWTCVTGDGGNDKLPRHRALGDITVVKCERAPVLVAGGKPDALIFGACGMHSIPQFTSPIVTGRWYFWCNFDIGTLRDQVYLDRQKAVRALPMTTLGFAFKTWTLSIVWK